MNNFKIAIVGRPNVGKSSLFNRIIDKRLSIVYEKSGTTKDRIYAKAIWLNRTFIIIDTGGISLENLSFKKKIKEQTEYAIQESNLIIFVTDGQTSLVKEDIEISKILHKNKKKVILAVNKIDNKQLLENVYDFFSLGFKDIIGISVQHGIGIGKLLDKIISFNSKTKIKENQFSEKYIKFCLIGKQNVGKSTLTNALLSQNRMIISNIPGTTTDAVDTIFEKNKKKYIIIDTPGLKKKSKMYEQKQDKYSFLRSINAIERSDIVCFILDISQKITEQDKNISALILNNNKPCIIIGNKWDLLVPEDKKISKIESKIKKEFKFFHHMPIILLSSINKKRIHLFFPILNELFENYQKLFSTSILNDILYEATQINPPFSFNGGKANFYFLKQIATQPPEFTCLVNNPKFIHFSYERFLKNQLRINLRLKGLPLKIIFQKKEKKFL
jgi:GTP-binding protein